jgi:hypothetical protein
LNRPSPDAPQLAPGIRSVAIGPSRREGNRPDQQPSASDAATAKRSSDISAERRKVGIVADLLRRPGGASMTEILDATAWQRTTARGRISDGVSKMLKKGEGGIWSRRAAGETYYVIISIPRPSVPPGAGIDAQKPPVRA